MAVSAGRARTALLLRLLPPLVTLLVAGVPAALAEGESAVTRPCERCLPLADLVKELHTVLRGPDGSGGDESGAVHVEMFPAPDLMRTLADPGRGLGVKALKLAAAVGRARVEPPTCSDERAAWEAEGCGGAGAGLGGAAGVAVDAVWLAAAAAVGYAARWWQSGRVGAGPAAPLSARLRELLTVALLFVVLSIVALATYDGIASVRRAREECEVLRDTSHRLVSEMCADPRLIDRLPFIGSRASPKACAEAIVAHRGHCDTNNAAVAVRAAFAWFPELVGLVGEALGKVHRGIMSQMTWLEAPLVPLFYLLVIVLVIAVAAVVVRCWSPGAGSRPPDQHHHHYGNSLPPAVPLPLVADAGPRQLERPQQLRLAAQQAADEQAAAPQQRKQGEPSEDALPALADEPGAAAPPPSPPAPQEADDESVHVEYPTPRHRQRARDDGSVYKEPK